jgi:hypothetical protein
VKKSEVNLGEFVDIIDGDWQGHYGMVLSEAFEYIDRPGQQKKGRWSVIVGLQKPGIGPGDKVTIPIKYLEPR